MDPIRILLADDHVTVRQGTRQILEREPAFHVIAEANDGQEALALVEEWHPDLAILDSSMPLLSGIEATRRIRKISPQTAVLVLTSYDDARYVSALLEAGAAGYLLKNARSNELIQAVRRITFGTDAPGRLFRARRSAGMETPA